MPTSPTSHAAIAARGIAAPVAREPAPPRRLGLARHRRPPLLHFMALASTLAAAKVILSTVGVALFLAKEGPAQLPLFYVLLAAGAILLSAVTGGVIDRVPRIGLGQVAFLGTLLGAAALRLPIAFDLPGTYYLLLASAHIYEIVLDIVFWVVVAGFLDTIELKRGTPLIYMALAAGGIAGGVLASLLSPLFPAADLLLALPLLGLMAAAQCGLAGRRLRELDEPGHAEPGRSGPVEHLRLLPRLIGRYPLILLIALNAALLTVLYGLCEYLVLTVYAERFPDERALTQFLAIVFAGIQALEFALLYVVGRPLLERAGPLARNVVFPISSLACLIGLAINPKLPAAIVTHVNAEAVSNAIFQPVNNSNYLALPLRFHGRIRTLADGVFYPCGLALAGVMLLSLQDRLSAAQIDFVAITFALLFIALNVGAGVLFLPTLVRNLRSDIAHIADAAPGLDPSLGVFTEQIGRLLRSDDPELIWLGLGLASRVDPAPFLAELRRLAPAADRRTRRAIAGLLARAPSAPLAPLLDELLDADELSGLLIALQVKLIRGEQLSQAQAERLAGSPSRSVAALVALVVGRPGALAEIPTWCRAAGAAEDVLDACAGAGRADLSDLLIGVIEAAPLEQQREGLAVLRTTVNPEHAAAAALARRLARHSDPELRAEAVGVLGVLAGSPAVFGALAAALGDRSQLVRRQAADALAAHGDAATEVVIARLGAADPGTLEATIRALGRIGSRRATQALSALPGARCQAVARNLDWLRRLPHGPEREPWRALELAIEDHNRRMVSLVLNVLAALGAGRAVADLQHPLAAADQRTRANALEALLALPQRRLLQPILPLLEAGYALDASVARPAAVSATELAAIPAAASRAEDGWIRLAAACTASALGLAPPAPGPDRPPTADPAGSSAAGPPALTPTELDMERILLLKRVPLFRYLPLDTLLAVSRALQRRHYIDRETILEAGGRWDHFCCIEAGAVDLIPPGGTVERLVAPAHFGELVLADEALRPPQVVAAGDCTLLLLHRIVFHDLSRDYPAMLAELCKILARRLRRAEDRTRSSAGAEVGNAPREAGPAARRS